MTESVLRERFERADYVADDRVVTTTYVALRLGRPLLVEGPPGNGKTELGKVLAQSFDADLLERLHSAARTASKPNETV